MGYFEKNKGCLLLIRLSNNSFKNLLIGLVGRCVRQLPGRPGFNLWSYHTKDFKNST